MKAVKDLGRVLVTEFAEAAIDIEAKARRRDKQDIVREVLNEWAAERHKAYRLAAKRSRSNGMQMELDVDDMEDDECGHKVRK